MRIGLCLSYYNPHLAEIVERAAVKADARLHAIVMGKPPVARADNQWPMFGDSFNCASPGSWARVYRWLQDADAFVFLGATTPYPWMSLVFAMACATGKPIYLASEGMRFGRTGLFGRLFLSAANLFGEGTLLAIGNSARRDFLASGLEWPARQFGFAETLPPTCAARVRSRMPGQPIRLLAVGQLIERKRIGWLIDQLSKHPLRAHFALRVCGSGPLEDELRRQAAVAGFPVEILGFRRGNDLAREFEAADVFVHPAAYEGWGVVLNHAAAFGLPIVAAANVRSAEGLLVQQGVNGVVFSDESGFAAAMTALAQVDGMLGRMSAASYKVGPLWSVDAMASRLAEAFTRADASFPAGEPLSIIQDACRL